MLDLGQRQHARQHGTPDAEFALAEVDGLVAGRRALHRQVQALRRVAAGRVVKEADIGQDDGVDALVDSGIDRLFPITDPPDLGEGIDGEQDLTPLAVGVTDAFGHGFLVEIQAGEIARIGVVPEAEIDGIGTVIDGSLEGWQAASRTNEFGQGAHGFADGKLNLEV